MYIRKLDSTVIREVVHNCIGIDRTIGIDVASRTFACVELAVLIVVLEPGVATAAIVLRLTCPEGSGHTSVVGKSTKSTSALCVIPRNYTVCLGGTC